MSELNTEFLCEAAVYADWSGIVDVGTTPHGNRQVVYITGGTFEGPWLNGDILPGGGDWFLRRSDRVVEIDSRVALRTDDGHIIYAHFWGVNDMPVEMAIRVLNGEVVDPSEYYCRIVPVLETASDKYSWLNRVVTVGTGSLTSRGANYRIYLVL